jgi:SAM-dependent methyltransferase
MIYSYKGKLYPDYLKHGNAQQFIAPVALKFCQGSGVDVGASTWPLPGAVPVELKDGGDAMQLPENRNCASGQWDYVFSSHCLEHLENPIEALRHWKDRIRPAGVLFLYLPHPDMEYWLPQNNAKHLHQWHPETMVKILKDLGFTNVLYSERDMAWGFSVVGFVDD